jgi:L-threonylcarbamoyladenylate synthase
MHVSPTLASHVVRSLGDRVDLVLDAGACSQGIESTVLDVTVDPPTVLRAGAASLEELRRLEPDVIYDVVTLTGDSVRASPGLAAKHYAPRTHVIVGTLERSIVEQFRGLATKFSRFGAILWSEAAKSAIRAAAHDNVVSLSSLSLLSDDPERYAHDFFAALHDADGANLDALFVEAVPDTPPWWAVADRLRRAATP